MKKKFNPQKIFRKISIDPYAESVSCVHQTLDGGDFLRPGECEVSMKPLFYRGVVGREETVHFSSFRAAVEFLRRHGQRGTVVGSKFGYVVCKVKNLAYSVRVECITHERAEEIRASMCATKSGKKYFKKENCRR